MEYVEVEKYQFRCHIRGRSHHPPLLFLHGFMGDRHEFDPVMDLLCEQFYCMAVDLPGHGKTQVSADDRYYTMADTAEGLIQVLKAIGIQQCCVIGYSMGGRLALYLTLRFPKYFLKTVLESASPGLKTEAERNQRIQKDHHLAHRLESEDFSAFLAQWYRQPLFATLPKHPNFELMLNQRLQNNPLNLARSLRHLSTGCQPSLWEDLHRNTVPLLLLAGELDTKFIGINTEMAERSPCAILRKVDRCGHNIHFENPGLFVHVIRQFLTQPFDSK
ncbi:MAG TPA: 2-succinyl-6-hydroxy-2,4-cyclohexadiene-1-carboxylate synthase [Coleofasciculaceae cyanobacterium]